MDIHKPKPWHGLREFLKEYAIIVVGVLTALGAEQGVEWLHWRHEVAETRKTLAGEIERNIDRLDRRQQLAPCFVNRLDDVHRYLMARAAGDRAPPPAKVGQRLGVLRLNTNAWEASKAAQLIAHMPPDERERYSRLYNEFEYAAQYMVQEREALSVLRLMDDAPMLEAADWSQVRLAWNQSEGVGSSLNTFVGPIIEDARAVLGARAPSSVVKVGQDAPAKDDASAQLHATEPRQGVLEMNQEFCRRWYPPAAASH